MINFGNVVNKRQPSAEDRFLHRNLSYKTMAELAYDFNAHQVAQNLHLIGEALQIREPGIAASLCEDAISSLIILRKVLQDGRFN